jgi:hypothetical protein
LLGLDGDTQQEVTDCALAGLETISLSAELDGVPIPDLEDYLVVTPLVKFGLPEDNILGLPAGKYKAVFAGYVLLFPNLSVGEHVIHMHDEFSSDGFVSDVIYNLSVTPKGRNGHENADDN